MKTKYTTHTSIFKRLTPPETTQCILSDEPGAGEKAEKEFSLRQKEYLDNIENVHKQQEKIMKYSIARRGFILDLEYEMQIPTDHPLNIEDAKIGVWGDDVQFVTLEDAQDLVSYLEKCQQKLPEFIARVKEWEVNYNKENTDE